MAESDDLPRIRAYLEHHRHTYEREALRQRLLTDGHDPRTVDLAIAQVYGLVVPPGPRLVPPPSNSRTAWFIFGLLGTLVLNFVGVPTLLTIVASLGVDEAVPLSLGAAVIVGEIVAALVLWRRNRSAARGILAGIVTGIVISIVAIIGIVTLVLILVGICLLIINGLSGP